MKFIFGMRINMEVFYKLILLFSKHSQVDFLHVDERRGLLQIDSMILMETGIPKIPKISSFQCLYSFLKKGLEMKLIFGETSKFPASWFQHFGH